MNTFTFLAATFRLTSLQRERIIAFPWQQLLCCTHIACRVRIFMTLDRDGNRMTGSVSFVSVILVAALVYKHLHFDASWRNLLPFCISYYNFFAHSCDETWP